MDVAAWLRDLGLERYVSAFRDNDIDAEVLLKLTAEDLIELPPNWWTPLLSSDGSGKVSNGPGTASFYG